MKPTMTPEQYLDRLLGEMKKWPPRELAEFYIDLSHKLTVAIRTVQSLETAQRLNDTIHRLTVRALDLLRGNTDYSYLPLEVLLDAPSHREAIVWALPLTKRYRDSMPG